MVKNDMNNKVFFSYSWLDMRVAMRLYDDLVRSGLNVWRDQINGDPTADFKNEFLKKIDECDNFILLDSKNYRKRSNWCLTEIEKFLQTMKQNPERRLIVCLLQEDGDWRKDFDSERHERVFSEVNGFKYQKLFYEGDYDNEDIYQKSLAEICKLFSMRFIPWNMLPSDRDLIEELSTDKVSIVNDDRELVLKGYEYISRLIELQRNCREYFKLWISDCESFKLNLFFPRWTYCVWLGHDVHKGEMMEECLNEFRSLARDFPNDPRSFRGLGCAAARNDLYDESISALKVALGLLERADNKWQKEHSKLEVLSVLGQVLINKGEWNNAIEYLAQALDLMESERRYEPQIIRDLVYCLQVSNRVEESKKMLLELIEKHPLESEPYVELGKIQASQREDNKALKSFELAYSLSPSVENGFYLLCRKSVIGTIGNADIKKVLDTTEVQDEDYYWKGAICYYLLNNKKRAKSYFDSCKKNYNWYE